MPRDKKRIYFNQWLKKRIKMTFVIALLIMIISTVGIVFSVSRYQKNYDMFSLGNHTNIKYVIPSPSKEQIDNMIDTNIVKGIVPTYQMTLPLYINNVLLQENSSITIVESNVDLDITPFSHQRLIKGIHSLDEDVLLIDYMFSKKHNLKIGDEIDIKIMNSIFHYEVGGIYENNILSSSKDGSVLMMLNKEIKDRIEEIIEYELKYSNAYIDSDDSFEKIYLKDYKPLGRLRERNEFPDDESYNIYIDGFMNSSFQNEIIIIQQDKQEFTSISNISITIILINFLFFLLSLVNISYINNKEEILFQKKILSYDKQTNTVDKIIGYYKKSYLFEMFIIIVFTLLPLVIYNIINIKIGNYIKRELVTLYLTTLFVFSIFSIVIHLWYLKKKRNSFLGKSI